MKGKYLENYGQELVEISSVLNELFSFPKSLQEFTFRVIPTYVSLIEHYKIYLDEFPRDDLEERKFFDPNWIPIAVDLEGFYVDPTDPKLPVFGTLSLGSPTFFWRRVGLIDSLSKLSLMVRDVDSIQVLFENHALGCMDALSEMFQQKEEMIYNGELPADPIEIHELYPKSDINTPTKIDIDNFHVQIENIYPLCISFLDHDTSITNLDYKWIDMPVLDGHLVRLTCIRNLITHIRVFEPKLMEYLSFKLDKSNIRLYYRDLKVDVFFSSKSELNKFIEQFNVSKNF
jgi:hypothetical protein